MRLATSCADFQRAGTITITTPQVTNVGRDTTLFRQLTLRRVGATAPDLMRIQTAAQLTDICRAIISVVTLRVSCTAVIDRPVMTFVACAAEVGGTGVVIITVLAGVATARGLKLTALIGIREAHRLSARVIVFCALV